jgi:hypothetical protein
VSSSLSSPRNAIVDWSSLPACRLLQPSDRHKSLLYGRQGAAAGAQRGWYLCG